MLTKRSQENRPLGLLTLRLLVIQHQKEQKLLHMLIRIQIQMFFQEQIYELLKT